MKQWLMSQVEASGSLQTTISAFNRLSQFRQKLVVVAFLSILFWLAITFIFMPFYNDYQKANRRLDHVKSNYMLLAKHAQDIASSKNTKIDYVDRSSTELRAFVNKSIKDIKLAPEVISREGQSRLRVGVSKVPFETVAQWLNQLAQHKVKINSMQIQALSTGMVSLRITLD